MVYKILLVGPQGSGKGTQAELLSEKFDIPKFAMGQLLRNETSSGSELGKKAAEYMNKGFLVTDEMAAEVLKKRLSQPDTKNGYILDGYPRNEGQYNVFLFEKPTHVIVIEVSREESLKRLATRLTCSECGKIFSMNNGNKIGDSCACGGEMVQRDDETVEAVSRRLDIYSNDTEPIIKKYEEQGLVYRIDGLGSIEEIQ
ncbi:MAG: nucleoside monophosphate kinase, partial [bacterium]|nr:nucleoside monophosphate kinase [bacterium]